MKFGTQKSTVYKLRNDYKNGYISTSFNDKSKISSNIADAIICDIPLPPLYAKEYQDGTLEIIKGGESFRILMDYMETGSYGEMKLKFQAIIEDYMLTIHIIKPPYDDAKLKILMSLLEG